jgi:hypothetical protein
MHDDSLNPDMQRLWGSILRELRESGELMLHTACADLKDVHFTADTIEITCHDDATFNLLKKHRARLGNSVNIHRFKPSTLRTPTETIAKLEEIFGDKLTVKK